MTNAALETQVKKQAMLLAKEVEKILNSPSLSKMTGKFIAYFSGVNVIADTHEKCFNEAMKIFGNNGFALAEITPKKPVFSSIVKL